MSEVAKNFVEQFANVPGTTVKEKHQNLFQLLHQHISLRDNPEDLEYITRNLVPVDHLHKIFRVDFLVYFHRFDELYEDFRNGDDITIRKVSKQDWFFQTAIKEVGAEDFVNNILPTLSYSLKLKILKKLPVEGEQADAFFDAVCKRYELFLATNLLPKCSSDKIREVITTKPVQLTNAQLKIIYGKGTDLIYAYFEERTKHMGGSNFLDENPLLEYIAQKNPKMFSDLFTKYKFDITLGRRTTKRFIDSQKEDVLKKPKEYLNILNNAATIRKLGSEMKDIVFKKSTYILEYYPKNKRFSVYRSAHDAFYRRKLEDDLDTLSEEVLRMIADPDEREHFAKLKFEKEDDKTYLKFVKPDYCLKKLMEKIDRMKSPERAEYIGIATYCCMLNKDVDHLLKVCDLVCGRFKNDTEVRSSFFENIEEDDEFMGKLSEQHWKLIMEIFATSRSKSRWICNENFIISNYVKYLIKNNKSVKEIVAEYTDWTDIFLYTERLKDVKVFKTLMTEIIEIGCTKPDEDDELSASRYDCLLAAICKTFNERNPKDTLTVYDHSRIRNSVKQMLESETGSYIGDEYRKGISYMVCQTVQSEEVKELKKLYFKAFKTVGTFSGLLWFLKHDPKSLEENFDEFLNNSTDVWVKNRRRLWSIIKKYSHFEFDKRIIEFCKLKLEEEFENKDKLITPLAVLSNPSAYLEFLKSYIPTSNKVDFTDDESRERYTIQGKLFRALHFSNDPRKVLPLAYELCRGDYLQFALSPLYSCIHKLPESETKLYIDKLEATKAISVKKHAMNLTCVIYDADTVYNCLKKATVPSLVSTLKYFAKNPSVTLWEFITNRICSLEKKELRELKSALNVKVPFKYRSQYIEIIYQVFDKYENQEYKKVLLPKIDHRTIQNFDLDFVISIMRSHIFKVEEANDFIASLLIHLKSEEKFDVLKQLMTEFKENRWDDKGAARNTLNKFIRVVFNKYMEAENPDREFVTHLSSVFKSVFPLSETFEEWVMLSLMCFKDETPENCGRILAELNKLLAEKYDKFAVTFLAVAVCNFAFKHTFKTDNERIKLYHALLKAGGSLEDYVLILKMLPRKEPEDTEHYTLYEEIYSKLSQAEEELVQLQFNLFLKSDTTQSFEKVIDWSRPQPGMCGDTC